MTTPIPFIHSTGNETTQNIWLQALSSAMPEERIVRFSALSYPEKQEVEMAIVASPDAQALQSLPKLKWIHSLWAGIDSLISTLGDRDLPIIRLIDPQLTRTMTEAVLAWVYYLQRDMPFYLQQQQKKQWQPRPYRAPESIRVGILGLGILGQAAAQTLHHAGFSVCGWSKTEKHLHPIRSYFGNNGLELVLSQSDILVILLPLTPETYGLMGQEQFHLMKENASLINFARGPIVVEDAMIHALNNKKLAHLVLDVFHTEPLPPTYPYWSHENITILPHISGATNPKTAAKIVADHIRLWRKTGQLPPAIDNKSGY